MDEEVVGAGAFLADFFAALGLGLLTVARVDVALRGGTLAAAALRELRRGAGMMAGRRVAGPIRIRVSTSRHRTIQTSEGETVHFQP